MTLWENQILDIWKIHARINLDILGTIDEHDLKHTLPHYATSVGGLFAHLHQVRLLWLQRVPGLRDGLQDIEPAFQENKEQVRINLEASASRVAIMLQGGLETAGQLPYFQPHLGAFVGYLIAHECMHHGEIGLILGSLGKELPLEVVWSWNQI